MSNGPPDISVTIATGSSQRMLRDCVQSLFETCGDLLIEVIVVDNCAPYSVPETVSPYPVTILCNQVQLGLAANQNRAMIASRGRYVFWINDDIVVLPGCMQQLLNAVEAQPRVAAAVPRMFFDLEQKQPQDNVALGFPTPWRCFLQDLIELTPAIHWPWVRRRYFRDHIHLESTGPIPSLGNGAIFFRRAAIDSVGWMDEGYEMYYEETDWCLRMQLAGWEFFGVADARIVHFGGQSTKQTRVPEKYSLMQRVSRRRYLSKFYPRSTPVFYDAILPALAALKSRLRPARAGSSVESS